MSKTKKGQKVDNRRRKALINVNRTIELLEGKTDVESIKKRERLENEKRNILSKLGVIHEDEECQVKDVYETIQHN